MLKRDIEFQLKEIKRIQKRTDAFLKRTDAFLKKQEEAINKVLENIEVLNEKARELKPEQIKKEVRSIENMSYYDLKDILNDERTDTETLEMIFEEMTTNPKLEVSNQAKGKLYRFFYENPNVSEKILCGLTLIGGSRLKGEMAMNPNMPAKVLKTLYSEPNGEYAFKILYRNPKVPKELLTAMAEGEIEMNLNWFLNNEDVTDEDVMQYVKQLCSEQSYWNECELVQIILKRHLSDEICQLIKSTGYEKAKKILHDTQK